MPFLIQHAVFINADRKVRCPVARFEYIFEPAIIKSDSASTRLVLAGWPAQLSASVFNRLDQCAYSPGNKLTRSTVTHDSRFLP